MERVGSKRFESLKLSVVLIVNCTTNMYTIISKHIIVVYKARCQVTIFYIG